MEELHLSKTDNSPLLQVTLLQVILLQVTLVTISINNSVTLGNLDSHYDLSALRHLTPSSQRLSAISTYTSTCAGDTADAWPFGR